MDIFQSLLAGLPEASMLFYPPETMIAEKFEAMIRFGLTNGRVKDFHDIWVATRIHAVEGMGKDAALIRWLGAESK